MEITSLASSGLSSQAVSILFQVFESMEEAVVIADSKRCVVMVNTAAERLLGCRQADVVGLPTKVFYVDKKDFEARGRNTFNSSVNQTSDPYIVRYQSMDGDIIYGETIGGPIRDESLSEVYFFAIIRDVSKRVRSEQTMSRLHSITSSRMLEYERRIYEILKLGCEHFGMLMGIVSCVEGQNYVVDAVYHPEDAVPEGATFELENTYCVHTLDADGPTGFYHVAHSRIQHHPCYLNFGLEAYIGCPIEVDGERYGTINFSSPDPVEAFDGSDLNLVRLFAEWVGHEIARNRDLKVLAETQAELEQLASTDPLTGCINRRAMEALLRNEYERFQRYQAPFTVAILDYDHFKLINDHYGHEAGDEALRTFARLSQQVLRVTDCVARWGGEEFLVLMPNTQRDGAEHALQRLRQSLKQTGVHYRGHDLSVTVSIGACQCDELLAWDRLVNQADQALYYAKETGRDRLVFFQDIP